MTYNNRVLPQLLNCGVGQDSSIRPSMLLARETTTIAKSNERISEVMKPIREEKLNSKMRDTSHLPRTIERYVHITNKQR